jgi:leader peptidase (prepilin peptidase) / N-methyltransferase
LTKTGKEYKITNIMTLYYLVLCVLLGVVVGSFLNVCADRLPDGGSLLRPPSHCPGCQRRLSGRDLIPIFSYLWLRGRCRYCAARIPRRVLWVEAGTGLIFGLAFWRYGLSLDLAIVLVYCCFFMVILVTDMEHGLILNRVVYPGLALALMVSILLTIFPQATAVPAIKEAAIGGGIGLGLFLLVFLVSRGGMGLGDVKMAAFIGLVTGYHVFIALLLAIIVGALVSILLLALKIKKRKESIPFGPFLSLAAIATMLWGNYILSWYQHLF